ncbi:Protein FAM188A-like protein [Diplonema papillatum]|nr:Protein FAM188A-like protein [Diplonema papillatum]
MADQLVDMLGISRDQANSLLEAAGGSVEMAMNLHFGSEEPAAAAAAPRRFEKPFDWYTLVWPAAEPVPASWLEQDLRFHAGTLGFVQKKNGPCGLLAVLQAYLIAELLRRAASDTAPIPVDKEPSDEILAQSIADALLACCKQNGPNALVALCSWKTGEPVGQGITTTELPRGVLMDAILGNLAEYKAPGGLVLLLYSGVLTRGVDNVKKDIDADAGDPPLVLAPFGICTSEMIGLFLQGKAGGNTSSYTITGEKQDWDTVIGMLTVQEKELGVPLADSLKSPEAPVWVVHGGDHFTTLFSATRATGEESGKFEMWHFNGLPPAGPRLARITVSAPEGPAKKAPKTHKPTYRKPKKGSLDDIVQANEDDRKARPGKHKTWRFEVVMAVDDPDVTETKDDTAPEPSESAAAPEQQPKDEPPVQYPEPTGEWRCATCYHSRFKTMCFGLNGPENRRCKHCQRPKSEALWSVWLHYDDFPPSLKPLATKMFGPKLLRLLDTKWPNCSVEWDDKTPSV